MSEDPFLVQCISGDPGHVMEVIPGGELEAKCKKRAEAGYLDALCLGYDDCPECIEDRRQQARRDEDYLALFGGCLMADLDGKCDDDCPCNHLQEIVDSPYARQVRGITVV